MRSQTPTVVVAGGTSGVGLAIANRLACVGAHVVINYFRDETAAALAHDQVASAGAEVSLCRADLATLNGVRLFAAFVRSKLDHIDQLVHAAGAGSPGRVIDLDGETLNRAVSLN